MKTETNRETAESIARRGVPYSWLNNEDEYRSALNWFANEIEAALNAERERAFTQGYVCACANVVSLHGAETIAREVLNANRPDDWSIIDKVDRDALKPIFDHEKAQSEFRGKQ